MCINCDQFGICQNRCVPIKKSAPKSTQNTINCLCDLAELGLSAQLHNARNRLGLMSYFDLNRELDYIVLNHWQHFSNWPWNKPVKRMLKTISSDVPDIENRIIERVKKTR